MSRFEQWFENASSRPNTFRHDLDHPPSFRAGSTLNYGGVSHSLPDSGQLSAFDTVATLESVFLYGGRDGGLLRGATVADHQLLDTHSCFQTTDDQLHTTSALRMETEQPRPATSYDSGTVSDTTYASFSSLSSLAELGDDESAEDLNNVFEVISPWLPELHLGDPAHSMNVPASQESAEMIHDVHGTIFDHVEVTDHPKQVDAVPPAVTRSAKTLSNYVRLVCACNRFKLSKRGRRGKRKRSAEDQSNKHSCEIRISKKIPRDGKYTREKAWIGTFATPVQRGRALDVGKYFLCAKRKKTFSDPRSEATLAAFKDRLQGLPLSELVEKVTKLAKYYGENGSLPQSLNDL